MARLSKNPTYKMTVWALFDSGNGSYTKGVKSMDANIDIYPIGIDIENKNNHERARISPATVDKLEGIISDELFNDLQDYLSTNYTRGKTTRPVLNKTNAGLPEHLFKRFREEVEVLRKKHPNNLNNYIREVKGCDHKNANKTQNALNLCYAEKAALTPLKAIQMEGLLSRELFSEIIDYVFNNYEWAERLDDEVDRIILKYRNKGRVGREKTTVRKALYTAYMLGV